MRLVATVEGLQFYQIYFSIVCIDSKYIFVLLRDVASIEDLSSSNK